MKEHGLSLGLSSFFKHEPLPPNAFPPTDRTSSSSSSSHTFFEALSILDHVPHVPSPSLCTPPLSPADSYISLYPLPPHLTPQPSPTVSPRSTSPTWPEHDHENVSTHLLGKLTVQVVEARGLAVSSQEERCYVLLQYDRTE